MAHMTSDSAVSIQIQYNNTVLSYLIIIHVIF